MYPYHIDSLIQLSEVCKMSEDLQMAAELIERAVYCFECNFHTLFNFTQANCRLDYSLQENRALFITLFKHLNFVDSRGCHRTALELCKLLLGLDPDNDPLCVLLMIDYFALRASEHKFLTRLCDEWETQRNLSQLPNFAFSLPLALFNEAQDEKGFDDGVVVPCSAADNKLQEALIMFPSVLIPLLDKCGVIMPPCIVKHQFFQSPESRNPDALNLLVKLFVERNFSLWKVPEVLTWLEANCNTVITRVDAGDPLVVDCTKHRQSRYRGTPRNIYRHVILSDLDQVKATLPKDISSEVIMMYDPLPPLDNKAAYVKPARANRMVNNNESYLSLFLRSLLPSYNVENDEGDDQGAGAPVGQAVDFLTESFQRIVQQLRSQRDQDGDDNQAPDTNQDDPS
ncbi:ribosome quality control complex subunit TCF25-like [Dysidea avara]|uniref:ribosome quality control complex subunit TCF25-like n=1 Tax=Dysidea avara TaxID=196820 RepID=UPI00331C9C73